MKMPERSVCGSAARPARWSVRRVRDEIELLEDYRRTRAPGMQRAAAQTGDVATLETHVSRAGIEQPVHHAQQCRFACTGSSDTPTIWPPGTASVTSATATRSPKRRVSLSSSSIQPPTLGEGDSPRSMTERCSSCEQAVSAVTQGKKRGLRPRPPGGVVPGTPSRGGPFASPYSNYWLSKAPGVGGVERRWLWSGRGMKCRFTHLIRHAFAVGVPDRDYAG